MAIEKNPLIGEYGDILVSARAGKIVIRCEFRFGGPREIWLSLDDAVAVAAELLRMHDELKSRQQRLS